MCRIRIATLTLLISACVVRHPARLAEAAQPQCAMRPFRVTVRIGAWSVDKFAGVYTHGTDKLTVRREDHRLLVEGWTLGTRELTADSVESWAWQDGCGVRYEFILPPDGPGAWLKVSIPDRMTTDWHR